MCSSCGHTHPLYLHHAPKGKDKSGYKGKGKNKFKDKGGGKGDKAKTKEKSPDKK